MPVRERMCNLTLTRAEWRTIVTLLGRSSDPIAAKAKATIDDVMRGNPAEVVSIYREADKWALVVSRSFIEAEKGSSEITVLHKALVQASAAMHTSEF